MTTLKFLQELGCISVNFKEVLFNEANTVSACNVDALSTQDSNATIIIDNCKWVATMQGMPIEEAKQVYSSDGNDVLRFDRPTLKLSWMTLVDNKLATTKVEDLQQIIKSKKEIKRMADFKGMTMETMGDFTAPTLTPEAGVPAAGAIDATNSFKAANSKFFQFNQKYGRLLAFTTMNEAGIKVSKRKEPVEGTDKRPVLKADVTDEVRKKYEAGKAVGISNYETVNTIGFREAKPSPITGAIIAVPGGTAEHVATVSSVLNKQTINFDENNKDRKVLFLNSEMLYSTIAAFFHGKIKEDEKISGMSDSWLELVSRRVNDKSEASTVGEAPKIKVRSQLKRVDSKLPLITRKNYIPYKTYKKAPQQNPTPEDVAGLNFAIESVIKTEAAYKELSDGTKKLIKWDSSNPDAQCTSEYFKAGAKGAPITVDHFDAKGDAITDLMIPVKTRTASKKDPSKLLYRFETYKIDDKEHGPMAQAQFRNLVTNGIGMDVDEFIASMNKIIKRRANKGKGKGNDNTISTETFLENMRMGQAAGDYAFASMSSADELDEFLAGTAF